MTEPPLVPAQSWSRRVIDSKIFRAAAGPRLIDLPTRVIALTFVIASSNPSAFESNEPLYVALRIASLLLYLLAAFTPLTAGLLATVLFLLFLYVHPEYLNIAQEPLLFSAAVLLSRFRWRASALLALLVGVTALVEHLAPASYPAPIWLTVYAALINCTLGLSGGVLEWRAAREQRQRVVAARAHERELLLTQLKFTADTHDTVSHALATQTAILRVAAASTDEVERTRLLAQLAILGDDAQQQLRRVLHKFSASNGMRPRRDRSSFDLDLRRNVENLCDAAHLGGVSITARVGALPADLPEAIVEDGKLIVRELVTNIVKHSALGSESSIAVSVADGAVALLVFESENDFAGTELPKPRSIADRARLRGGSCAVSLANTKFRVRVELPVSVEE